MTSKINKKALEGIHIHPEIQIPARRESLAFMFIGGVGSGKTQLMTRVQNECISRSFKFPNHRTAIYDIKGEITATLPYPAIMLAPWSDNIGEGKHKILSIGWDIAQDCQTVTNARLIAGLLIQDGGNDPMWSNAARLVLAGLFVTLNIQKGTSWSWGDVANLLNKEDKIIANLLNEYYPEAGARLVSLGEKTMGSVMLNLASDCSIISDIALNPKWSNAHKNGGFSFKKWLLAPKINNKFKTLIIQGSNEFQLMSDTIAKVIFSLFGSLMLSPEIPDDPSRKVNIFLDEFANLPQIEMLPKMVTQLRSKGGVIYLGTQSWVQVEETYTEKIAQTISENIGNKFFLATTLDGAKWVSEQIGQRRISIPSQTQTSDGGNSNSFQDIEEPTVPPEVVAGLPQASLKGGLYGFVKFRGWNDCLKLNWEVIPAPTLRKAVNPAAWTRAVHNNEAIKLSGENLKAANKQLEDEEGKDELETTDDLIADAEFLAEYADLGENPENLELIKPEKTKKYSPDFIRKMSEERAKARREAEEKSDEDKSKNSKTATKITVVSDPNKDDVKEEEEEVASDEAGAHVIGAVAPGFEVLQMLSEMDAASTTQSQKTKTIVTQVPEKELEV